MVGSAGRHSGHVIEAMPTARPPPPATLGQHSQGGVSAASASSRPPARQGQHSAGDGAAGTFCRDWINADLMGLCCAKDLCGALRLAPRRCAPVTPGLTVSSARGARSTRQYFRPPHPASRPANLKRGSEDSAHSLSFLRRVHLVVIWMTHTYVCEYACWCGVD